MTPADSLFTLRPAVLADARVMATHRVSMFRDMGRPLTGDAAGGLLEATSAYLLEAIPGGEYLAWLAEDHRQNVIGGAGAQLRRILPRLLDNGTGLEPATEAIIVNVYVDAGWRRRGIAEVLLRALLRDLRARPIGRIVLHASAEGRRLYERLGFVQTNEMRLSVP